MSCCYRAPSGTIRSRREVSPPIAEVLLVPFRVAGEPIGTIWVIAHECNKQFDGEDLRLLNSLGRFAALAQQSIASTNATTRLADQLAQELASTQQLQLVSTRLIHEGNDEALYRQILDAAVGIMAPTGQPADAVSRARTSPAADPDFIRQPNTFGGLAGQVVRAAGRCGRTTNAEDVETCEFIEGTRLSRAPRKLHRAIHAADGPRWAAARHGFDAWRKPTPPGERDLHLFDVRHNWSST